jgi:putative thioredoxin
VSANPSPNVFEVEDADFERDVIQQSHQRPVVVDFWAEWCKPCLQFGPLLERMVEERAGAVALAKVNVERAQELALAFRINSIPAIVAFRNGRAVRDFVGMLPEQHLRTFLDSLCPTEADRLAEDAAKREEADPDVAEQLYRKALELDGKQPLALIGLARRLLERDEIAEAEQLLDRLTPGGEWAGEADRLRGSIQVRSLIEELPPEATVRAQLQADPGNGQLRYQLGCHLAAAGKFPEALEELLAAAESDRKLAGGPVKEAMVLIFHAVGVVSPLADEYRQKLVRILY